MNSKKLIYTLLISVFIFSCSTSDSEKMTSEDLKDISADCDCAQIDFKRNAFGNKIKGSLMYDINTKEVFSGTCEEKFGDGSRKQMRQYANGKLHGNLANWDENGVLRRHLSFSNGEQDEDQFYWYSDEKLKEHSKFKNGIKTGEQLKWNEDNKLIYKKEYLSDGKTVINSGFDYRKSNVVRKVWKNLKDKARSINNNSIEVHAGGNDKEYYLNINEKMTDKQILDFIRNDVIKAHFNNDASNFIIGTSGVYKTPKISLNSEVYGYSYENKKEVFRIALLLMDSISEFKIPFMSKDNSIQYYKVIDGCTKVNIQGYGYALDGVREVCDFEWFLVENLEPNENGQVKAVFTNDTHGYISLSKIESLNKNVDVENKNIEDTLTKDYSIKNEKVQISISLFKISDPDGYSNLRKTPGGEIIKKVYEDERFEVLGEKDKHKEVKLEDGTTGYIHESRVTQVN